MLNPRKIFISYARKDGRDEANALYRTLQEQNIPVWLDERDLDLEQDFTADIEVAIESATHVIVCITPESKREDSFVRREIQYALLLNKIIIPLRFADIPPHIHIATYSWIDFFKDWTGGIEALIYRLTQPLTQNDVVRQTTSNTEDSFRQHVESLAKYLVNELKARVLNVFSVVEMIQLQSIETPNRVRLKHLPVAYQSRLPSWLAREQSQETTYDQFAHVLDKHNQRVLVLGEPGAGKTTTLLATAREFAYSRLANPNSLLPIYAPVYTWKRGETVVQWLSRVTDISIERLKLKIESKQTILLLDGLDELSGDDYFTDSNEEDTTDDRVRFMQLLSEVGEIPVIVTCRIRDYDEIVQKSGEKITLNGAVTLAPLTDKQIEAYLREQPLLWNAILADDDLREMVRTPLLLTLLAVAYRDIGEQARQLRDLHHSPADLRDKIFRSYVQRCYEIEQIRSPDALPFSLDELYYRLGEATVEVLSYVRRHEQFEINTAVFEAIIGTRAEALIEFGESLHLLISRTPRVYHYTHLLLRDHFAFPVCLMALQHSDVHKRSKAARALGILRDKRAFPALLVALNDNWASVRWEAAHALGEIADASAVEALIGALSDSDEKVRWNAAWALSRTKGQQAVQALIRALRDVSKRVRGSAAVALGRIGDPRAIYPLIETLHDDSELVYPRASWALGELGNLAVQALIETLYDEIPRVRLAAVKHLGRVRDLRSIEGLVDRLGDNDQAIAKAAKMALVKIGEPAVEALAHALQDQNKYKRQLVENALIEINGETTIDQMITLLMDEPHKSQGQIAYILYSIGAPAIDKLMSALDSSDSRLRSKAAWVLGRIGGDHALDKLISLLLDDNEVGYVREKAAWALGKIGNSHALHPLLDALSSHNPHLRVKAIWALGKIGDKRALEKLIQLLDDDTKRVRETVIQALGEIGDPRVVPALTRMLNHENEIVRKAAQKTLQELENEA